jgi:DNA-binding transcriptional regulator YiaG
VDLIEVLARLRGALELEHVRPRPIDVKAIRKQVKVSQAEFLRAHGISKRASRNGSRAAGNQMRRPRLI